MEIQSRADLWIGVGTFDVVTRSLFYQLFIITVRMRNGVHLPMLFAFLPKKELASYDRVFAFLVAQGFSVPSKGFQFNFETNIRKAIRNHYTDIPVYRCDTHFKRALRAHCFNELGLRGYTDKRPTGTNLLMQQRS